MRVTEKIKYYKVKNGFGFWQPSKRMRDLGFKACPCGRDGDEARRLARSKTADWETRRLTASPQAPDRAKRGFVYFLFCGDDVKIGFTTKLLHRVAGVKVGMPKAPTGVLMLPGTSADEKTLHHRFDAYRRHGEWFTYAAPIRKLVQRCLAFDQIVHDDGGKIVNRVGPTGGMVQETAAKGVGPQCLST